MGPNVGFRPWIAEDDRALPEIADRTSVRRGSLTDETRCNPILDERSWAGPHSARTVYHHRVGGTVDSGPATASPTPLELWTLGPDLRSARPLTGFAVALLSLRGKKMHSSSAIRSMIGLRNWSKGVSWICYLVAIFWKKCSRTDFRETL